MFSIDDSPVDARFVVPGEVIELTPDGAVSLSPPCGWMVVRCGVAGRTLARRQRTVAEFGDDEVLCTVRVRPYSGSVDELLAEVLGDAATTTDPAVTKPQTIRTADGVHGRLARCVDDVDQAIVAAFVTPVRGADARRRPLGVEVVAVGTAAALDARAGLLETMLTGLRSGTRRRVQAAS